MENKYPDAFLVQRNGGIIIMERFLINWVVENGHPHYKIYDKVTDQTVHCDEGELNETILELLGV